MIYDLVLKNISYLDVKERTFKTGDIAINNGIIININTNLRGKKEIDYKDRYLVPGFIDSHIHLESSIINPIDFTKMVSLHGTTSVVTDPHEIANVCGKDGIKWMIEKTKNLPVNVYIMISSCVPASSFDESAYNLSSKDVEECFSYDNTGRILGLAEMMNYPGVINDDKEVLEKIRITKERGLRVDGHAPRLLGKDFEKYISAGIESDHECSTFEEAKEKLDIAKKLNKDFYIMIREGTAAKNLEKLHELISLEEYRNNVTFATDDKHPEEIFEEGHIDSIIRKAIRLGVDPIDAYITSSYNAATYFNLKDEGSIEIGKKANLVVLNDINTCSIEKTFKDGIEITDEYLNNIKGNENKELDNKVRNCIHMREVNLKDIKAEEIPKKVIGLVPGELLTTDEGFSTNYDPLNDIVKLVVIEPHKGTMHTGVCYLKGLGLESGAIGTTVSHDSHYAIVAGTNDEDIIIALNEIRNMQGGKIVVRNKKVLSKLPLPIANLMTDLDPSEVIEIMKQMKIDANLKNKNIDPFMNLSFLSLPVIGDIRLLPGGVFNVKEWHFEE